MPLDLPDPIGSPRRSQSSFRAFKFIQYAQVRQRFDDSYPVDFDGNLEELPRYNGNNPYEENLYLNVFAPEKGTQPEKYPVMAFIQGGIFPTKVIKYKPCVTKPAPYVPNGGEPKGLVKKGVVVVTIHYRTGILGFLSLDKQEKATGLAGFKDLMLALQWIKKYIKYFDGDSNNVTFWGQGLGAAHIHWLLVNKRALPFHKAILQSSMAYNIKDYGIINGCAYAQSLGCRDLTMTGQAAFLRSLELKDLIQTPGSMTIYSKAVHRRTTAKMLELSSYNSYRINHQIPILMGYNNGEGVMECIIDSANYRFILGQRSYEDISAGRAKIMDAYYGVKEGGGCLDMMYEIAGDICYKIGIINEAKDLLHAMNPQPVYLYEFGMYGSLNVVTSHRDFTPQSIPKLACHGDELGYLFDWPTEIIDLTEDEWENREKMLLLWSHFAKTGNPNYEPTVGWKPLDTVSTVFKRYEIMNVTKENKMNDKKGKKKPKNMTKIVYSLPALQAYEDIFGISFFTKRKLKDVRADKRNV